MTKARVQKTSSWSPHHIQNQLSCSSAPQNTVQQLSVPRVIQAQEPQQMPESKPMSENWVTNHPLLRGLTAATKENESGTIQRLEHSSNANSLEEEEPLQTKLTIGQPGDQYEQEADKVAAQVMSMTQQNNNSSIERETEKEEEVQTKPLPTSITPLFQRKTNLEGNMRPNFNLEKKLNGSKGRGSSLSDEVRGFMEPRFGADFSKVRVHTDTSAVQMNRQLNAQAFTHGSDIYFGEGKSAQNNELTAHELTHVVQQTGGIQLKRNPGFEFNTLSETSKPTLFRKPAPSATESVGGTSGTVTFLPNAPGSGTMSALAPGESGYTSQLLPTIPAAAGKALGYYKEAHLTSVSEPTFKWHTREILRYGLQKRKAEKEVSGWAPASINKLWEERAKGYEKMAEKMASEIYSIQSLCKSFNAWAPRANLTFVSLARLEGLQELLGVKDPSAMVSAVTEGLKQAQLVAERAKISSPGSLDVPEADRQVASSVAATTMASSKMRTAWLGFQQILAQKNIDALKKAGEKDEKRLKEINEVIDFCGKVGKTIDLSLSVLEGGGKLMAAGSGAEAQKSAKDLGKTMAKGVGIDIPSDAEGLLKGIAKLAYLQEIEKIETKLAALKTGMDAHKAAADELGVTQKISAFEDALKDYKRESQEMHKRLIARQLAYVKLGEQLDEAAKKDPTAVAGGIAPGKGKERFATIMLVTSAVREVLAMGNGAKTGFSEPASLRSQISSFEVIQNSPSDKVPASEVEPLISIYKQTASFHANVNELTTVLGPIDQQAAAMMTTLSGGAEVAGAY